MKPDIICISMSGLGHTGPLSSYVSYGPTLQALTGYTQLMAEADDSRPATAIRTPTCAADTPARSPRWSRLASAPHRPGAFVDLSQFEAVASVIGPALLDISVNGRKQSAPGYNSQEGPAAPHGVTNAARSTATTIDGSRSAADAFRVAALRRRDRSPHWASDPKFRTLYLRMQNSDELDAKSHDGRPSTAPKTRWRLCKARASQRASSRTASTSARAIRNCKSAASGRPSQRRRARPPTSPASRSSFPTGPDKFARLRPKSARTSIMSSAMPLGLGKAERDELVESGAVWP